LSYIGSVLLRDRPPSTDQPNAGGTLEERLYFLQNWRADVVLIAGSSGSLKERTDFSAYGQPILERTADFDGDGDVDGSDNATYAAASGASVGDAHYNWKCDFDNDGDIDGTDFGAFGAQFGTTRDRGELSSGAVGNTRGYAGYVRDTALPLEHVRHRVYRSDLGRWTRRDPAGYVDGGSLYGYVASRPLVGMDPMGLCSGLGCGGGRTISPPTHSAPVIMPASSGGGNNGSCGSNGDSYNICACPPGKICAGSIDYGSPQFFDWNAPGAETSPRQCFENYWPGDCTKFAQCQAAVRMSPYPPGSEGNNECYEALFRTAYDTCTSWFDDRIDATNKINNTLAQCTTTNWDGGTVGGIGHGFWGCFGNCIEHNLLNGVGKSLMIAAAVACGGKISLSKWWLGMPGRAMSAKNHMTGMWSIIQHYINRLSGKRWRHLRDFGRSPASQHACYAAATALGSYMLGVSTSCTVLCRLDPYNY
jgi:RHS repeat-associated protein